jgi:SAM-dependent methyltransferase
MRLSALAGASPVAATDSDQRARDEALVDELLRRATEQMAGTPEDESQEPSGHRVDDGGKAVAPPPVPDLPPLPATPPRIEAADDVAERLEGGDVLIEADSPLVPDVTLSPLAQTLANMAESLHAEPVLDPSIDIDIVDAPLVPPKRPRSHSPSAVPPPLPSDSQVPAPSLEQGVPEALADRPRRPRRSKPWYEEVFDENYLRTLPFMTPEQTLREVDFIETSLAAPKGSGILDIGCGYGRHAIELVQRGLAVTGLDLSLPLLLRAAEESQKRALSVNFVHSDMRGMAFDQEFDGAYCMLTSFGYFDEESNLKVAEGIARALKPGGRLLLDVVNRDYIVGDLPARIWWEGDGCVVLEEVEFNFNTSRILTHRSVVFEDGRQLDQEISVRAYSLHELGKLLRQTGLRVIEVSGSIYTPGRFFGAASRNLLVLAERRRD